MSEAKVMTDAELVRAAAERVMGWVKPNGPDGDCWVTSNHYVIFADAWNPLLSDADCWMLVDKLATIAGSYHGGDGFFILRFGEWADHGEGDEENPCTCGGLGEDDDLPDKLAWSAHFHIGLMSEGPEYPAGWDHGKKFCARAGDRRRAITLACLRATASPEEHAHGDPV